MRILSVILAIAIAASTMGAMKMPQAKTADAHSCCKKDHSAPDQKEKKDDCGTCLMTCCRIISAPAEPVATLLARTEMVADLFLPPLLANDLAEPGSIFHPPRA